MVACAFVILCTKWRNCHRASDVYPDFCDVIVETCCILHDFVRQRVSGFFYANVPSRELRLLALEERIWEGGFSGRASLFVETPLGSLAGGSSIGDLCVVEGSGYGHLSPYGPRWDAWGMGGGGVVRTPVIPERYLKEGS
jgi:hypothetical protein